MAITTEKKLKEKPGAIARTRDFIDYVPGSPGWALIDFDRKGMPSNVETAIEAAGGMWNALLTVAPGLQQAARVSRTSTSAGLFRTDTGEQFAGSGGAHHYVLAKDAGDIERFLRDLHDRCWLQGLGWHLIGNAGQLLDRSLVDRMVAYGERLCFEGAPIIEPPLAQDPSKRIPEAFEGEAIDTGLVVPRLTEYERHRVEEAKAASAEALGKAAAEIRTRHDRTLAEKISTTFGMPLVSALRLVTARHRGVLLPYLELEFDHLGIVTVAEVLADPDQYVGETLADPLEGVELRPLQGQSHAGRRWRFVHSQLRPWPRPLPAPPRPAVGQGCVDTGSGRRSRRFRHGDFGHSELEPDELADFTVSIAKAAGIGVRAVMARISKERRERDRAQRKATISQRSNDRIVRPRPEPDGELTPTVAFLDQVLGADPQEEPPMRDVSGNLVEVRVREPWALHSLTSDGVNDESGDTEVMKAPAEPGLVRLTPVRVELLLERYVGWLAGKDEKSYFAALPRPYIDALMQFSPSAIPVVRAINTAPLVSMSGNVIDGVGLDRSTGLVHRIDPLLRACVPTGPPTEQAVRDAVGFSVRRVAGRCRAGSGRQGGRDHAGDDADRAGTASGAAGLLRNRRSARRRQDNAGQHDHSGGTGPSGGCSRLVGQRRGAQEGAVRLSAPGYGVPRLG